MLHNTTTIWKKKFREEDYLVTQSPPTYRRMSSREDGGSDVFSRLGAGTQDPFPGGSIQKYMGKVIEYIHYYLDTC